MSHMLLYHRWGAPLDGKSISLRLVEPKHIAMGSKLATSQTPIFGFICEQRLTKGSRGVVAKVQHLAQHADGSFELEALVGEEFVVRTVREEPTGGLLLGSVSINSYMETEVSPTCASPGISPRLAAIEWLRSWAAARRILQQATQAATSDEAEERYYRYMAAAQAVLQMHTH